MVSGFVSSIFFWFSVCVCVTGLLAFILACSFSKERERVWSCVNEGMGRICQELWEVNCEQNTSMGFFQ